MSAPEDLVAVLERARDAGFLGPGPVMAHLDRAEGFAIGAEDALGRQPRNFVDLGSGGGVPGLVLALRWNDQPGMLVEVGQRRAAFLRDAVVDLGLGERIEVVQERGEAVARSALYREQFELITARSFAPPAVTAEIAAGLMVVGGILVVSDPPEHDSGRWPPGPLAVLGLGPAESTEISAAHFSVIRKVHRTPDRFPRAVGRPSKRPLW